MRKCGINAKPFVKWVGGKTQLLPIIAQKLPDDFSRRTDATYIEPFVGGGAVLFWILQQFPNIEHAVINDINADLTSTYVAVRDHVHELIEILDGIETEYIGKTEYERKEFYMQQRERFNGKKCCPVENSALFIFLNRTCFNGLHRVNSRGLFNVPFGRYANPTICDRGTLLADSELLQRVEILTGDFERTSEYMDENSLVYLDPPYKPLSRTSSFNSYSKEAFDGAEQVRLNAFCKQIDNRGIDFILSNSDVKGKNPEDNFFDDLYRDFSISRVQARRMVNADPLRRGALSELMISNIYVRTL